MMLLARPLRWAAPSGFRIDRARNVAAVRAASRLPIIGIYKNPHPGIPGFHHPPVPLAAQVVQAGANLFGS